MSHVITPAASIANIASAWCTSATRIFPNPIAVFTSKTSPMQLSANAKVGGGPGSWMMELDQSRHYDTRNS
jgi:hypothetical protein